MFIFPRGLVVNKHSCKCERNLKLGHENANMNVQMNDKCVQAHRVWKAGLFS